MSAQLKLLGMKLTNFGRHQDLDITFSENLTVIKGPNGAGKSTVLQAPYFAFFGVSAVDGKASDIPFTGEKNCSVALEFDLSGDVYTITRTLKDATLTKFVDSGMSANVIIATGHTAVNQWVERNLGVTQKLFMTLTYSAQTETAAIMSIGAATLNRMVEEIAEADFISRVEKKSADFQLAADIGLRGMEAPQDIGELTVKLTQAEVTCVAADTAYVIAEQNHQAAQQTLRSFKPVIQKAREDTRLIAELRVSLPEIERNIGAYESAVARALSDITTIDCTEADVTKAKEARAEISGLLKEAQGVAERYTSANDRVVRIKGWLATRKPQVDLCSKLNQPLLDAAQAATVAREAMDTSQGKRNEASAELGKAKQTLDDSVCPTCERPFDDAALEVAKKTVERITLELVDLNADFTAKRKAYLEADAAFKKINDQLPANHASLLQSFEDKEEELKEAETQLAATPAPDKDKIETWETWVTQHTANITEMKNKLSSLEDYQKQHAQAAARLQAAQGKKKTIEDKLQEIGEVDLPALQAQEVEFVQSAGAAELAFDRATQQQKAIKLTVEAFKAEITKTEQLMQKRTSLERRKTGFSGLTKYLRENRETFMAEMWTQLMGLTSEFVSSVTDGKISAILRGEGADFYYVEDGIEKSYARLAGGFKAIAGVGLRVALASLLPAGVSLVVLDEPSSELRDDLAASLAGALRATDRQIVLVTHREGEEFASDQVINLTA